MLVGGTEGSNAGEAERKDANGKWWSGGGFNLTCYWGSWDGCFTMVDGRM